MCISEAISLLSGEVVHHHDLTAAQTQDEHLLDLEGLEDRGHDPYLHRQTRPHALGIHAGEQEDGVFGPQLLDARSSACCD
jgi:hypothetical protein